MQALFIHGMGRTPRSGWPLLWQLKRAGLKTSSFRYAVSQSDFASIQKRLIESIVTIATQDDYILIGHSLGGVLLRAAVLAMPPSPPPRHIFLLGSPLQPVRLAQQFNRNPIYQRLTGDCGQLLGSATRMAAIGALTLPTTSIVGIRGLTGRSSPFKDELNDSIVALSEVSAEWLTDQVHLPTYHTLLPASLRVAAIILARLGKVSVSPQNSIT
jgi:hypothetical protein